MLHCGILNKAVFNIYPWPTLIDEYFRFVLTLISLSSTHSCRASRDKPGGCRRRSLQIRRIPKRNGLRNEKRKRLSRDRIDRGLPHPSPRAAKRRMEVSARIKTRILMVVRTRFEKGKREKGGEIRRSLIAEAFSSRRSV